MLLACSLGKGCVNLGNVGEIVQMAWALAWGVSYVTILKIVKTMKMPKMVWACNQS